MGSHVCIPVPVTTVRTQNSPTDRKKLPHVALYPHSLFLTLTPDNHSSLLHLQSRHFQSVI